ncbi:nickel-dependent lactate racemase [candidate division KSB1 bacterium]|nr:nickel-dependent lactate racemase [candidate division KSB1 bacterium]
MATFNLPYHKSHIQFEIPDHLVAGCLESRVNVHQSDLSQVEIIHQALDCPVFGPTLESLVEGNKRMTLITSDHTRPVPSWLTLPILLERIRKIEPSIEITILVATGYHRETTQDEMVALFGEKIVSEESIVIHDSRDDASLVQVGVLPSGGELWINRLAVETDLLMAEGFIEPHFFAGYSGGRKSVLPGVAGYKTVLANHCSEFIASDHARTGILDHNPIHHDMIYAAQQVNLKFILNVILNDKKEVIHAVAGDMEKAHHEGCAFLSRLCQVDRVPADIVITSNGGYPLDQNIYQSVKGMTAAEAMANEGGVIIMVAACNDGHGGESFFKNMAEASHPQEVLERALQISRDETVPDQWEYQILARILDRFRVILVTDMCDPSLIKAMHLDHAQTIEDALDQARRIKGEEAKIAVIPDGVSVIVKS